MCVLSGKYMHKCTHRCHLFYMTHEKCLANGNGGVLLDSDIDSPAAMSFE